MRRWIIVVVVIALVLGAVFFWPFSSYDKSRVHPSITGLQEPYQSVVAHYYLDGGSIGLEILDRNGQRLQLAIPIDCSSGDACGYPRLFIGSTYTNTNTVEIVFTRDTRRCLSDIIDRYSARSGTRDVALVKLRGSPRDRISLYSRAFWRRFNGQ